MRLKLLLLLLFFVPEASAQEALRGLEWGMSRAEVYGIEIENGSELNTLNQTTLYFYADHLGHPALLAYEFDEDALTTAVAFYGQYYNATPPDSLGLIYMDVTIALAAALGSPETSTEDWSADVATGRDISVAAVHAGNVSLEHVWYTTAATSITLQYARIEEEPQIRVVYAGPTY